MKNPSDKKSYQSFLKLCTRASSSEELEKILDLFLTIEEKEILSSRYQIIQALLEEKISQREMAKTLGVSISQITRGSNALKTTSDELKQFIKKK
ncbi:MAG: trp operon repressor [Chlamydiales bacterium]|nr:trp operon repressor [Chlamydiales bacterium]